MDGVHPSQTYNAGIKVVYNQITRQHPRCDDEEYFLAFESVLNRDPTPLTAVKKNALWDCNRLNSDAIQTLSSHASPIPALVANRGYDVRTYSQASHPKPCAFLINEVNSGESAHAWQQRLGSGGAGADLLNTIFLARVVSYFATTVLSSASNSPLPTARPLSAGKTVTFADPVATDFPCPFTGGDSNTEFSLALDIPFMAEYISFAIPRSKPPQAKRSAFPFYSFLMKNESLKRPASTAALCTNEENKRRVDIQDSCGRDSVCGNMMKNEV